jgi:hypothetical protein
LKLFLEWGNERNGGGGEFQYDTFSEPLKMPQCIPIQHNNKIKFKKNENRIE